MQYSNTQMSVNRFLFWETTPICMSIGCTNSVCLEHICVQNRWDTTPTVSTFLAFPLAKHRNSQMYRKHSLHVKVGHGPTPCVPLTNNCLSCGTLCGLVQLRGHLHSKSNVETALQINKDQKSSSVHSTVHSSRLY